MPLSPHARARDWNWPEKPHEVKVRELKAFIGLNLLMGVLKLPAIEDYWSKKHQLIELHGFSETMYLKQFQLLLRYFHTSNNALEPPRDSPDADPLFKVRHTVNELNELFRRYYQPHENVAVDESMVPYQGHHEAVQFMPNKRHARFGPKLWVLADEKQYIFAFDIYRGKRCTRVSEHGLTFDVVTALVRPLQGMGYHVFTDNFYTSPTLFRSLEEWGLKATGTVKANRSGLPQQLKQKKPAQGECSYMRQSFLLAAKYRDKKEIMLLSTACPAAMSAPRGGRGQEMPVIISTYNRGKGHVDCADQKIVEYAAERRTVKLWKKITFHLLDRCLLNAHVLYEASGLPHRPRKDFILEVISSLVTPQRTVHQQRLKRRRVTTGREQDKAAMADSDPRSWHFGRNIAKDGKRERQRLCVCCKERKSGFECPSCPSVPALCRDPCFKNYHFQCFR